MKQETTFKETLATVENLFKEIDSQDVRSLRVFLETHPVKPMISVASGGAFSTASYASLLYSASKGISRAVTPLTYSSISDQALENSKVLLFSKSGKEPDIEFAAKRSRRMKHNNTALVTQIKEEESPAEEVIKDLVPSSIFSYNWKEEEAFISSTTPFAGFALFYRAMMKEAKVLSRLKIDLNPESCFKYFTLGEYRNRNTAAKPEFKDIKNYIVLYSGWSEPVAQDFESKMIESGCSSVQLCDYRNFGHGRFIFPSNHLEDSVLVLFLTPREKEFVRKFILEAVTRHKEEVYPDNLKIVTLESGFNDPLASIDLLVKSSVLFDEITRNSGIDPLKPANPAKIDKRAPKSTEFGGLLTKWPLTLDIK